MPNGDARHRHEPGFLWNCLGKPIPPEVVPEKSRLVAKAHLDAKPDPASFAVSAASSFHRPVRDDAGNA
jgi:hypothetical protein